MELNNDPNPNPNPRRDHEEEEEEEEERPKPFDIDLNETPVCSPRDAGVTVAFTAAVAVDEEAPPPFSDAYGYGGGDWKGKGKLVFDMNAIPVEALGGGQPLVSGWHNAYDTRNNAPMSCSTNLSLTGNQFEHVRDSRILTSIPKLGPVNIVQQRVCFGSNLKEATVHPVYTRRGRKNNYLSNMASSINLSAKFGPTADVDCHSVMVSDSNCTVHQERREGLTLPRERLHFQSRCDSMAHQRCNDLREDQEILRRRFGSRFSSGMEAVDSKTWNLSSNLSSTHVCSDVTNASGPSHCKDVFPVQFEDFVVLSIGKIDPRPSYHNTCQIWPIGYKSSWHDMVTGSLFVSEVSDGGDRGPVFRVQRYSCSTSTIPVALTVLSRPKCGADCNKTHSSITLDDQEEIDIRLIFSEDSPPSLDFNAFSSIDEKSSGKQVYSSEIGSGGIFPNYGSTFPDYGKEGNYVGEFVVEEKSSHLAWRMVSENFVRVYRMVYSQADEFQPCCGHAYGLSSSCMFHKGGKATESNDPLGKFCHTSAPFIMQHHMQSIDELSSYCDTLRKWLDQDRFGLDTDFVQDIIEQLPGIHACSDYIFLNQRKPNLQTVGSGFLLVKRTSEEKSEKGANSLLGECDNPRKQAVENCHMKDVRLPGKPLSTKLPASSIGDVLQSWEVLWRFSEFLGLKEPLTLKGIEEQLIHCDSFTDRSSSTVNVNSLPSSAMAEIGNARETDKVAYPPMTVACEQCFGGILSKTHCKLLKLIFTELQSKLAAAADPTCDNGDHRAKKKRKKEADSMILAKKTMLELLPLNDLTWPELARRYIEAASFLDGSLDSLEVVGEESYLIFNCLQGGGGAIDGSLPGVAGTGADALVLVEATRKIFGSSDDASDTLIPEFNDCSVAKPSKKVDLENFGEIPKWAQLLEPVRKLPTNVGARIRNCIYQALDKNPPEWAKKRLEHSISKQVYKGNASGPTKKAVIAVLADLHGEYQEQQPNRKRKNKCGESVPDLIMKQCQKVLRLAVAGDDKKEFCKMVRRMLRSTCHNSDGEFIGFPSGASHPLDFRTIDQRLDSGTYAGSHEAFLEDVCEVWNRIRTVHADESVSLHLADKICQNFEALYEKEVLGLTHKVVESANSSSPEFKKEIEDLLQNSGELPEAPWDDGVCELCMVDKDDKNVLLCDQCDGGYHLYCLNPPLAKVPKGKWYCPFCVEDNDMTQSPLPDRQLVGQLRRKRHQGDFMCRVVDALARLSATMELKDYWDYSLEERISLLKFLGDEVLITSTIREHIEQCAAKSVDLQHKRHSLFIELETLKFREEFIARKVAESSISWVNDAGKSGKGGVAVMFPFCDKLIERQKSSFCSSLLNDTVHLDNGLQEPRANDLVKEPFAHSEGIPLHLFSGSGTQIMKTPDLDLQHDGRFMKDVVFKNYPSHLPPFATEEFGWQRNHILQEHGYDCNGDDAAWRDLNRVGFRNGSSIPVCRQVPNGLVSSGTMGIHVAELVRSVRMNSEKLYPAYHGSGQVDMDELQALNHEASFVKNQIRVLQESAAFVESQLEKVSLRKELLGKDSAGRLYWAFFRPGSSPWVLVEGKVEVPGNTAEVLGRPISGNFSSNPVGTTSWFCYQSDAEIQELVTWLKENRLSERDLLDALMLRLRFGSKHLNRAGNTVDDSRSEASETPIFADENYSNIMTKASIVLEKRYGPFAAIAAGDTSMECGQDTGETCLKSLYRCGCLEPVWASKFHCHLCHSTFRTRSVLEDHKDQCYSFVHASEKCDIDEVGKGKALRTEKEDCTDIGIPVQSEDEENEVGSRLVVSTTDESPYKLGEISTNFVTTISNEELVKEIGLLGSNGAPSFINCSSPYLDDPALKIAPSCNGRTNRGTLLQQAAEGFVTTTRYGPKDFDKLIKSSAVLSGSSGVSSSKSQKASLSAVRDSSLRPIVGRSSQMLRLLKKNLLDIDAALPDEALKHSKTSLEKRCSWRAFVRSAKSIFEMVQATIVLENVIKAEFFRNEWSNWSSLTSAARIATISSLALRIYTLDAAILYDKPPPTPKENTEVGRESDNNVKSENNGKLDNNSVSNKDPSSKAKSSKKPVPDTSSRPTAKGKPDSKSSKKNLRHM